MSEKARNKTGGAGAKSREERLKAALKENLKRRKGQARARAADRVEKKD